MLTVDGSRGEGGGQVLRTALTLSCLVGVPIRIERIRAGRQPPGLKAQHLAAVRAAARISNARVEGDQIGSTSLVFEPGPVVSGHYRFDVGTAGAATLVLQTIVYPLAATGAESVVEIVGGTHVPWAPAWPYLEHVWAWWYARLGGDVELSVARAGFFPKGGGQLHARIRPAGAPKLAAGPIERGRLESIELHSQATTGLADHVLVRQLRGARQELSGRTRSFAERPLALESYSPGTHVLAVACCENARLAGDELGRVGKRAEDVGRNAARGLVGFLDAGVPFDEHMADQVLLPLALTRGSYEFPVASVSGHLATNAEVIVSLLPGAVVRVEGAVGEPGRVVVGRGEGGDTVQAG